MRADALHYIDSHCHIHDSELYDASSRDAVYQRAIDQGVGMVCIGTDVRSSRQALTFAADHDNVWAMVGVHPHDTKNGWQEIEPLLGAAATNDKLVGIGEIGLDYFYNNSPRDVQIKALEEQLSWAVKYHLPISFHVREAFDDFWPVFENFSGVRGILHSFTDTAKTLERGLSHQLYIGVNGISTFTKDAAQQQMFQQIPLKSMVLETDAPFLTPKPFRGKVNEPVYVKHVAAFHATLRGLDCDQIGSETLHNTRHLLSI